MKLKRILELNDQFRTSNSLPLALGDGYLIENNFIFRNIRSAAKVRGLRFHSEPDLNFQVFPLSQLEVLLQRKEVPYYNNVSILKELENQTPEQIQWDDIVDGIKKNYHFHESCHFLARNITSHAALQDRLVSLLMEESFANTCEFLSNIDAADSAHRCFLEANSYCLLFENRTQIKNAMSDVGPIQFSKFMILTYLSANFLLERIDDRLMGRICKIIQLEPQGKIMKSLRAMERLAFELNPRFREQTASFYFRSNKIQMRIEDLRKYDFLKTFETKSNIQKVLHELTEIMHSPSVQ